MIILPLLPYVILETFLAIHLKKKSCVAICGGLSYNLAYIDWPTSLHWKCVTCRGLYILAYRRTIL